MHSLASASEDSSRAFATRLTLLLLLTLRWWRGPASFAHELLRNCSVVEIFRPIVVAGLLQAPGRCRGSSRVVLKAAPGIGDQRRVLLKPLHKPIFVVRSRNSRRSSVGAGPPIVSLKTMKIQRFRCHFVMVWTETIFRNLPRSGRAPLVPFGFPLVPFGSPWPLGPLPLALWVPLGPLGGWGGGGVPGVPLGPRDRHLVEARKGRLER